MIIEVLIKSLHRIPLHALIRQKLIPKLSSPQVAIRELTSNQKPKMTDEDFHITHPTWKSKEQPSPVFISNISRELYTKPEFKVAPGDYYNPKKKKLDRWNDRSAFFKNQIPRFDDKISDTPDPGSYDVPSGFSGSPTHCFDKHFKYFPQEEPQEYPGPGSYETKPLPHGKSIKISTGARWQENLDDNPPVGNYNIQGEMLDHKPPVWIQMTRSTNMNDWSYHPSRSHPSPADYSVPSNSVEPKVQKHTHFNSLPLNRLYYEYEYE